MEVDHILNIVKTGRVAIMVKMFVTDIIINLCLMFTEFSIHHVDGCLHNIIVSTAE